VFALTRLRHWARAASHRAWTSRFRARDARTPKLAKLLALLIAAYALSPIDLIPDFVPVLGYLDDLLIVPLGIWLVVRMIPAGLMAEYRALASQASARPISKMAACFVVLVWLALAAGFFIWLLPSS
jgi:uncharacterized membrane protein YkvA (DUF1232 family)